MCEDHNCQYYIQMMWQLKHWPQVKVLQADLVRANKKLRDAREELEKLRERVREERKDETAMAH
jgi:hypothetical protein